MKKYLMIVFLCILGYGIYDYMVYYNGNFFIPQTEEPTTFSKAMDEKLWINSGDEFKVFDIKGVNLGLGKPGKFATQYSITKEEYLRWFGYIQDMGANVIRTYTLAHQTFYEAFYEYNVNNPEPLYLIHGVWVDDYMLNSHRDAFDEEFYNAFRTSCKEVIDTIHGKHKNAGFQNIGIQRYTNDISQWVYGYIAGVEWEGDIVAFTNETRTQLPQYKGEYLYTEDATNFEIFLAMIGDEMIRYETDKYGTQRTLAFSNWPATDPLEYTPEVKKQFKKYAHINVENIKQTEKFLSGQYASYHFYPYYPEYAGFLDPTTKNTYLKYLTMINEHHDIPVVISEFGIPSSRGMASYEQNQEMGRNQGYMNEQQQGEAIISLYEDIKASGSAGAVVFIWQDEWFKRTWNTLSYVDLERIINWSDYQTNEQYFGLLAFDPGKERSVCYVDGDISEWMKEDIVVEQNGYQLSMKYDEKFIYFLAQKDGLDIEEEKLYIPIDLTPNSGSKIIGNYNITTTRPVDFLIEIDGKDNSRVWVQERYNSTNAIYGHKIKRDYRQFENPPAKDSTKFDKVELTLHELNYFDGTKQVKFEEFDHKNESNYALSQTYETGKLTYGNANPRAEDFNSLADFSTGNNSIEIKLPWQMLNFADPSNMKIHDDYYEKYGVENIKINEIYVGLGNGQEQIEMEAFDLEPLGQNPQYHERLKKSYYILKDYWNREDK